MFTLLRPVVPPLEPIPAYVVKIDLNHANSESLLQLPGIGPVLAQRIIAYRDEHGPFQNIDQLKLVKGIGPVLIRKLRSLLEIKPGVAPVSWTVYHWVEPLNCLLDRIRNYSASSVCSTANHKPATHRGAMANNTNG